METLQRGLLQAWRPCAVRTSPGGEQVAPGKLGAGGEQPQPGGLELITRHTQGSGCQEAEGFWRLCDPKESPLAERSVFVQI